MDDGTKTKLRLCHAVAAAATAAVTMDDLAGGISKSSRPVKPGSLRRPEYNVYRNQTCTVLDGVAPFPLRSISASPWRRCFSLHAVDRRRTLYVGLYTSAVRQSKLLCYCTAVVGCLGFLAAHVVIIFAYSIYGSSSSSGRRGPINSTRRTDRRRASSVWLYRSPARPTSRLHAGKLIAPKLNAVWSNDWETLLRDTQYLDSSFARN